MWGKQVVLIKDCRVSGGPRHIRIWKFLTQRIIEVINILCDMDCLAEGVSLWEGQWIESSEGLRKGKALVSVKTRVWQTGSWHFRVQSFQDGTGDWSSVYGDGNRKWVKVIGVEIKKALRLDFWISDLDYRVWILSTH